MSAQSILINNIENKRDYFQSRLLQLGDNLIMNKRFMIGEKVDRDEMNFVESFYSMLCTDNCELKDYINKKIQGKLGCDYNKDTKISDSIRQYHNKIKACPITEVIVDCCSLKQLK